MTDNPYESPTLTPQERDQALQQRFRWRIIPVAGVACFGAISIFTGVFGVLRILYKRSTGLPLSMPPPVNPARDCAYSLVFVVVGAALLWAARLWWHGHWKRALAICIFLYAAAAMADLLNAG